MHSVDLRQVSLVATQRRLLLVGTQEPTDLHCEEARQLAASTPHLPSGSSMHLPYRAQCLLVAHVSPASAHVPASPQSAGGAVADAAEVGAVEAVGAGTAGAAVGAALGVALDVAVGVAVGAGFCAGSGDGLAAAQPHATMASTGNSRRTVVTRPR